MNSLTVSDYTRMFFDADEAAVDERREGKQGRDYYDGKQYTHEELEILKSRRQPPTTLNRVARKINHLAGMEVERRSDPKAYPRTEKHTKAAEAATDALRYVEQTIKLDEIFSALHGDMLVEGYGAHELTVEQNRKGEYVIGSTHWRWDCLFYDPHSVMNDFSDAMYLGGVEWLDVAKAKAQFPGKAEIIESTTSLSGAHTGIDDYDDKPERKAWVTKGSRKRIRIVHMYHLVDGEWYLCQFTGGGILSRTQVPFVDEEGTSWCPMVFQSAYVDRDGDRYGEVRNLISPQDMINKTHSKLQHLISVRQLIAREGVFSESEGGIDGARQEFAKPDGVITINGSKDDYEISSTADQFSGHAALLQEFKSEIDLMGPNASMQGKGPQSQSGRALIAQTEGGMREFTPVADRFNSMKERTYRYIWFLIKQYWTEPKWIRVTDDESTPKFVGLNQPVSRMEMAVRKMQEAGADEEQISQAVRQIQSDPRLAMMAQQIGEVDNQVAEIDVDITIELGPNIQTLQIEQFEAITQMVSAGVPIPPDVIVEMSSLRNKEKILERMRGGGEQSPEEQQAAQQQREIELEAVMAKIDVDKSIAARNYADAQQKATPEPGQPDTSVEDAAKQQIDAFNAETNRMKAEGDLEIRASLASAQIDKTDAEIDRMRREPVQRQSAA